MTNPHQDMDNAINSLKNRELSHAIQSPSLSIPTSRLSTEDVMESMSEAQDSITSANSIVNDALTSALKRLEMLDQETVEINKIINMLQQQAAMFRTPISQLKD